MATVRAGPCAPGLAVSCRPVGVRRAVHKRAPVARAQDDNPFAKFGSQLVQAGSQFTQTFTGTTRVARKNVVKDDVVFVAGASGRVGSRIVKECAKAGYTVRAGVRSKEKGQDLMQNFRDEGDLTAQQLRKIRIEEYDLFERDTIAPAIGNAACVVCSIGAPESKPFDQTGPRRIDGDAAITLVQTASKQGVKRFMMVTSLGTTKFGLPASILNLFWGVLYWKKQAENELIRSGMLYTIIRPGGMERPTDTYKDTHNTVMYPRDKMFTGQISRLQVAEVIAACVESGDKASNKTIELVASNVAPPRTILEMLEEQPVEITVEELREKQAEIADVRNRADGFSKEAEELEAKLAEAEEKKVKAEQVFSTARSSLQEVKAETAEVLKAASEAQRTVEQLRSQKEQAIVRETAAKAVLDAQRTAQRESKVLSAKEIRDVADSVLNPEKAASADGAAAPASKPAANPFASLFGAPAKKERKQEEAAAEEAAPAPARAKAAAKAAAPAKVAAKAAPAKKEVEKEEEKETAQVKGGGLFGMFQQDTVYADEVEDVVPPATELVERAVTKKGSGRKSVKELVGSKSKELTAPAAPVAAKTPAKPTTPPPKPAAAPAKPSMSAPKGTDKELAAKREKAVAAALNNLGVAAKKVEEKEVKKEAKAAPNGSPPAPAKKAEPAAPAVATISFAGDKEGAKAWIKNWKSKQPAPAFSFKLW